MRLMFDSKGAIEGKNSKLGTSWFKRLMFLGKSDNELICDLGRDLFI